RWCVLSYEEQALLVEPLENIQRLDREELVPYENRMRTTCPPLQTCQRGYGSGCVALHTPHPLPLSSHLASRLPQRLFRSCLPCVRTSSLIPNQRAALGQPWSDSFRVRAASINRVNLVKDPSST